MDRVFNITTTGATVPEVPLDDRSNLMIIVVCVLIPFISTVVALRIYTRARLVKTIGIDDWVVLLSLIFTAATGLVMAMMTKTGLGHHIQALTPAQVEHYLLEFYLSIVFYYVSLGLIKLALLLQYFPLVAVKSRKLMIAVTALISTWSLVLLLVSVFNCRPIEGFWKQNIGAVCIPTLPSWYANAAGNILTDLIIFALPIPVVWKLKMPRAQRYSLLGVFGLGFFTCTISIVRIGYLNIGDDYTYANLAPAGWSLGELCAGVTCACLPTLRPLLFRVVTPRACKQRRLSFSRSVVVNNNNNNGTGAPLRDTAGGGSSVRQGLGHQQLSLGLSMSKLSGDLEAGSHDGSMVDAEAGPLETNGGRDVNVLLGTVASTKSDDSDRGQVFRNVM